MVTKKIQTVLMEELLKKNIDGTFPFLITIENEVLDEPLRLISDNVSVKYQGRNDKTPQTYYPSCLAFTPPQVNGKEVGTASLSVSAIDARIIEIIRTIKTPPKIKIVAGFMKKDEQYFFSELNYFEFTCETVQWDRAVATFSLVYDNVMKLNVPKTDATVKRFPACYDN